MSSIFCSLTPFELKSIPFLPIIQKFELAKGFVFTIYSLVHFLNVTNWFKTFSIEFICSNSFLAVHVFTELYIFKLLKTLQGKAHKSFHLWHLSFFYINKSCVSISLQYVKLKLLLFQMLHLSLVILLRTWRFLISFLILLNLLEFCLLKW